VQNRYNLIDRKSEDTLKFCEQHNIANLPWYPMGGSAATSIAKNSTGDSHTNHPIAEFAEAHNATVSQLAIAWLLHRSPVILPIPGTSSILHLEENVAASALNISEDDWDALDLIVDTQRS